MAGSEVVPVNDCHEELTLGHIGGDEVRGLTAQKCTNKHIHQCSAFTNATIHAQVTTVQVHTDTAHRVTCKYSVGANVPNGHVCCLDIVRHGEQGRPPQRCQLYDD